MLCSDDKTSYPVLDSIAWAWGPAGLFCLSPLNRSQTGQLNNQLWVHPCCPSSLQDRAFSWRLRERRVPAVHEQEPPGEQQPHLDRDPECVRPTQVGNMGHLNQGEDTSQKELLPQLHPERAATLGESHLQVQGSPRGSVVVPHGQLHFHLVTCLLPSSAQHQRACIKWKNLLMRIDLFSFYFLTEGIFVVKQVLTDVLKSFREDWRAHEECVTSDKIQCILYSTESVSPTKLLAAPFRR